MMIASGRDSAGKPGAEQQGVSCRIAVTFFDEKDGTEKEVQVPLGQSLLEAAHENEIDLEGAHSACAHAVYLSELADSATSHRCMRGLSGVLNLPRDCHREQL